MPVAPAAKNFHGRAKQLLRDAAIPVFRFHGERAEKTEAAPIRREIRTDQLAIMLGAKRGCGVGLPARVRIIRVAHKDRRIGHAKKCAEGHTNDPIGRIQIALNERPNHRFHAGLWRGHYVTLSAGRTRAPARESLLP